MNGFRNPALTVDIVIEHEGGIVLIERRNPPLGFALPGGFVDYGESVETAAVREALEETGLHVTLRAMLGVYSDPTRDPRQHTVSVVFVAEGHGVLRAGDDAADARVISLDALPTPLCFDHARIIADYRQFRLHGASPAPRTPLTDLDRRILIELAWQSLSSAVALPVSSVRPAYRGGALAEPGACLVTLRHGDGEVAGVGGSITPSHTLASATEEATKQAAGNASQSAPITRHKLSQLRIELHVVNPPWRVQSVQEITVGVHGLAVELGDHVGYVPPDAAVEHSWSTDDLAAATCDAAGLDVSALSDPDVHLWAFTSERIVATND